MIDLKKYKELTTMMVLATCDSENIPYTSNMYFRCDENYNFYFKSKIHREHSKHIINNENVAWSVINTEKYGKSDPDKKGLQFQGTVRILQGNEAEEKSESIYNTKKSFSEMQDEGHYIFICSPKRVKIWDEEKYGGEGKIFEF